jgi:phosphoglycolate phosphatase-like HAD superfamily hydrolase
MQSSEISVVITDLDNTLFDWVETWWRSFTALVDRLVTDSGIAREQLLDEIRDVHQRHGTSEYAFLIEELPSLRALHPANDLAQVYDGAIHDFRTARKASLKLFPGVLETLRKLKRQGVLIVGYTESMAFYTNYRIRNLGLDGLLDYLYSPPDHDIPTALSTASIRRYPDDYYRLRTTEHRHTPKGELKPNPKLLLDIIADIGAKPEQCLYVGDSAMKDIAMAQHAGVADAYAAYGKAQHRPAYELLRRVTHWTPDQVEREKEIERSGSVSPTHTLEGSFSEILALFDFSSFLAGSPDNDRIGFMLRIWEKTVDVQQHFNDIEMKIRNSAITVMAALLGATGFALKEHLVVRFGDFVVPIAASLLLTALLTWAAFYFVDEHWYHRLLYGAVRHGQKVENSLRGILPEITLTDSIGRQSPFKMFGWEVHSIAKMRLFYGTVGFAIIAFGILIIWAENRPPARDAVKPVSVQSEGSGVVQDGSAPPAAARAPGPVGRPATKIPLKNPSVSLPAPATAGAR